MEGQIVKIVSDMHYVAQDGSITACKCRGKLRQGLVPLVGDYCIFDAEQEVIESILPRKNSFVRPAVANIDQAILVTSLKNPDFSTNLLDKMLVIMETHRVKPIICYTKEDIVSKVKRKELREILKYYRKIGYTVVSNQNLWKLRRLLRKKTSVFTGQTGAGKSTLLNKLNPTWDLETGEVSIALGRGRHTTRVVELFPYLGGSVLDTPGFSSIEFEGVSKEEIRDSFIEFQKIHCPYDNCMHLKEAECLVKVAVDKGKIRNSRYENYEKIVRDVNKRK